MQEAGTASHLRRGSLPQTLLDDDVPVGSSAVTALPGHPDERNCSDPHEDGSSVLQPSSSDSKSQAYLPGQQDARHRHNSNSRAISMSKADASRLTKKIVACTTWQELGVLYQQRSSSMDFIHLSAALTHLAKLWRQSADRHTTANQGSTAGMSETSSASAPTSPSQGKPKRKRSSQQMSDPVAGGTSAGTAASHASEAGAVAQLSEQLQQQLCSMSQQLRPREAANVTWAMARLGRTPVSPSVKHLLQVAWSRLGGMNSQELSNTLYAAAMMGTMLSPVDMEAVAHRIKAVIHMCEPQGLANIVWALGKLGRRQHPATLRVLLRASYARMYDMTPEGLSGLAYGFAMLRVRLPRVWCDRLLDAAWRLMPLSSGSADAGARVDEDEHHYFRAPVLSQLLWALVKAQWSPPRAWLAGCLAQIQAHSNSLGMADVFNVLWALARLRIKPPLPLLAAMMEAAYTHMKAAPVEVLAGLSWALARLRVRPANAWAERFLRAVFSKAQQMHVRHVVTVLWAISCWGLRPNAKFVHGLLNTQQTTLATQATDQDLLHLARTLPKLQHPVPTWAGSALVQLAVQHLPGMTKAPGEQVMQGLRQLGLEVQGMEELIGTSLSQE